jgi:hypothetical protein
MNFEIAPKSTEIEASWDNARLYCFLLDIDGKTGWRLPTIEELNEIFKSQNDFEKSWYWSSTERNDDYAWFQYFSGGGQNGISKDYSGNWVRAIRDLKDN